MLALKTFNVYEYPLKNDDGKTYYGSYTIVNGISPLGYKGEKLVSTFKARVKVSI